MPDDIKSLYGKVITRMCAGSYRIEIEVEDGTVLKIYPRVSSRGILSMAMPPANGPSEVVCSGLLSWDVKR